MSPPNREDKSTTAWPLLAVVAVVADNEPLSVANDIVSPSTGVPPY